MQQVSFKLSFLSPAFLGGAYPKREANMGPSAELRVPSIIGQLRWWHRFLGKQESEARIFGSVAGESGRAAGFTIRLLNIPEPVHTSTTPTSLGLSRSYFLYTQEMDNGANLRAALTQDNSFDLIILNRKLISSDWQSLIATVTAFSWLGSLGNRSRRGFGALTLRQFDGKDPAPVAPTDLLTGNAACILPTSFKPQDNFIQFATAAGNWLSDARKNLKDSGKRKADYFGSTSENGGASRLASPILLRPWPKELKIHLLLIGPHHLLSEFGHTQ